MFSVYNNLFAFKLLLILFINCFQKSDFAGGLFNVTCQRKSFISLSKRGWLENFCLGGFNKAASENFSDFAFIPVLGIVLLNILPLGVVHKVICNIGVNNGDVVTVDFLCKTFFKGVDCLFYSFNRHNVVRSDFVAGINLSGRILNVCTCVYNLSCNGVKSSSGLVAENNSCFKNVVVNSGKIKHIRNGYIITVLIYGCRKL